MIYLIGQFWLWLFAALVLGLAVGWFTFRGRDGAFWRGLIPWAMLLGVGALVAASRVFRDGPGFWVDLGMLLTGCYFIGCFLGDLWKGRLAEETAPAVARADPVFPVPAPPPVSAPLPAADPVSARPKELAVEPMMVDAEPAAEAIEQAITGLSRPRDGGPDDLTRIFGIDPETEGKLNALGLYHFDQIAVLTAGQRRWLFRQLGFEGRFPSWWWRWKDEAQQILGRGAAAQPAASAGLPAEPVHAGVKPRGLQAPREGEVDDLKRIRGIGPQNEARLHALGIWHFDQIAGWSAEEVQWVGSYLAFPGRIERENWVEQARQLATGAETEFSKRVAKGLVPTSADDGEKGQDNIAKLDHPVKKRPMKPQSEKKS
jgi:predicted flap endonuclease-1-like 5' DNA nuclease